MKNGMKALTSAAVTLTLISLCMSAAASAQTVSYAGIQSRVAVSGLTQPGPMTLDAAGDLFIVDGGTQSIVEIPAGGGPQVTLDTGVLSAPNGLAVDAEGDVYISESGSGRVVKYPAGCVVGFLHFCQTLILGGLTRPAGLALDETGDLFIADSGDNLVIELPAGCTSSSCEIVKGYGFNDPTSLAIDADGNLFILDWGSGRVAEIKAGGSDVTTVITGLLFIDSIAVDGAGNLFVSEDGPAPDLLEVPAGTGAMEILGTGLGEPTGVSVDAGGNVFVADYSENQVQKIHYAPPAFGSVNVCPFGQTSPAPCSETLALNFATWSNETLGDPKLLLQGAVVPGLDYTMTSTCTGALAPGQSCIVNVTFAPQFAGLRTGAVQITDANGNVLATTPLSGIGVGPQIAFGGQAPHTLNSGGLSEPVALALDGAGNLFIAEHTTGIMELPSGLKNPAGYGITGLNHAEGVALDGAGNLYVSDWSNGRVLRVLPRCMIGSSCQSTVASGLGHPSGLAVDLAGNVYVADFGRNQVLRVTPTLQTSYLGSALEGPNAVAVDAAGDLFIGESLNGSVVEIPAGGAQKTIAAGLGAPSGVAVDAAGDIFISDAANSNLVEVPANGGAPVVVANDLGTADGVVMNAAGDLFVADSAGNRVIEIARSARPATLIFPTRTVVDKLDSADGPRTVAVENIGNGPLVFTAPTTGNNPSYPAGFPVSNSDAHLCTSKSPLAPGASCDVSVDFRPTGAGYDTASVVLTDNALSTTQTIALSGDGVETQTIAITPLTAAVPYGAKPIVLSAKSSSGLPVSMSVVSGPGKLSGSELKIVGAGTIVVVFNQAGNTAFAAASQVEQKIEVKKAVLVLAAKDKSMIYGQAAPAFGYTMSGFVDGDTASTAVKGEPKFATITSKPQAGRRAIDITAGSLTSANYSFILKDGVLTVDKASLKIAANNLSVKEGAAIPKLTCKLSGFVDGDTQSSATTGAPKLITTATSKSKPGEYPVIASAGTFAAKNYKFTFADGTLTVTQ